MKIVKWDKFRDALEAVHDVRDGDGEASNNISDRIASAMKAATEIHHVKMGSTAPNMHLLNLWASRLQTLQMYRKIGRTTVLRALRNLPEPHKMQLLEWFNQIWETSTIPDEWKESLVVPIPKPGKPPTQLGNLCPISLTSNVYKLLEGMVLCRIQWHLKTHAKLDPMKTGFRPHIGAQDSLLLLHKNILDCVNSRAIHALSLRLTSQKLLTLFHTRQSSTVLILEDWEAEHDTS